MDRRSLQQTLEQRIGALRLIAGSLAASVVLYAGVAWMVQEMFEFEPLVELSPAVSWSIAIGSLFVILTGYLIERSVRNATAKPPGRDAPRSSGRTDAPAASVDRYIRSVMIGFAFREAAAVIGFVLSFLTGNVAWALGLSGVALASMLIHWPRRAAVEDWLFHQGIH